MKCEALCIRLLFPLLAVDFVLPDDPEVNTDFGPVRGTWLWTARALEVAAFLGIPYAEPPIGNLRFENPRAWTAEWKNGTLNATADGSMCLQRRGTEEIVGDEDCLFLNVYTPTIAKNQVYMIQRKVPVLVFIHGGGFRTGSSNSSMFAPTYLLDYDIILVTMNYRLNVLGFFSSGNQIAPGNYGLKDIALAIRWVHDNIEAFGGDPRDVSLAGHDAGAVAAQLLAVKVNASEEPLFHKLITMSGVPNAHWSIQTRRTIRNSSLHVARLLGCTEEVDYFNDWGSGEDEAQVVESFIEFSDFAEKKIMNCMKTVDAGKIIEHGDEYVRQRHPMLIFTPTLESEAEGAILTFHPERSLSEGLFRDIPWIIGVTDDEGLWKTTDFLLNSEIRDELIQDYEKVFVSYILELKNTIDNVTAVSDAIKDFYFNGDILANFETNVTQSVGDALVSWPSYNFLQRRIINMTSNVYFYLFAYEGTFSNTFRWGIPFRLGAAHDDDVNYLFPYLNTKFADLELFNTLGDRAIINTMCEMWSNFMKTGVPSAKLTPKWEPYQQNHRFMRLGKGRLTDRETEENFLSERMSFWSELMKNFSLPIEEYRVDDFLDDDKVLTSATASIRTEGLLCLCLLIFRFYSNSLM